MQKNMRRVAVPAAFLCAALHMSPLSPDAQSVSPRPTTATDIQPNITTPNSLEASLGTLNLFDPSPGKETVRKVYEDSKALQ